tara:strand:- start:173 stop:421 length:249 start_codon:yes stop_codon:yes gene_type:complete
MKKIIAYIFVLTFIYSIDSYSDEKDCSSFDKLSKDYAKCLTDKSKKQGSKIKKKINDKIKKSGIKEKFKKFNETKTLADLLK